MWGEEAEDFKEDLRRLPLERMIGEEEFLGSGDLTASGGYWGSIGDRGESKDVEDGNGTESWTGGRERKREGWLFCWEYWTDPSFTSSCWSCSSLKWNKAFFWVGLRLGREPRETKAPGPGSSEKEGPHERVRLWDRRGLPGVVMVVVVGEDAGDVDEDEGTE
jgi:hypothetical protein